MYSTYTISPIGTIPFQLTFLVRQMHHLISASFRRSVQSCAVSRFVFTAIFVLEDGGLEPIVGDREGNEIQFASPETETK